MFGSFLAFFCTLSMLWAQPLQIHIENAPETLEIEYRILGTEYRRQIIDGQMDFSTEDTFIKYLPLQLRLPKDEGTQYPSDLYHGLMAIPNQGGTLYFKMATHQETIIFEGYHQSQPFWETFLQCLYFLSILLAIGYFFAKNQVSQNSTAHFWSRWNPWHSAIFWVFLSMLWNIQTLYCLFNDAYLSIGKHHDSLGTLWFMSRSPEWGFFEHRDYLGNFPQGIPLGRLDSFVLWLMLVPLPKVSPLLIQKCFLIVAMASSAWAAEYWSKDLGAKTPYSWIAGLGYMGSGLAAYSALEGHLYHLFQPWLPLLGLHFMRFLRKSAHQKDGILSILYLALCMWSSAYLGIGAWILILGLAVFSPARFSKKTGLWLMCALGIAALYVAQFFQDTQTEGSLLSENAIQSASTTFENLLGIQNEMDDKAHSLSLGLLPTVLGLVYFGRFLPSRRHYKTLLRIAVFSLILSMGHYAQINHQTALFPLPLLLTKWIPGLNMLDFPIRLAWVGILILSIIAAQAATDLAKKGFRVQWIFMLLLMDLLFLVRLPMRQEVQNIALPDAMQNLQGPIHHLIPIDPIDNDSNLHFSSLICAYQIQHQQPTTTDCLNVDITQSMQYQISQKLYAAILNGDANAVQEMLLAKGLGSVVFFPDLFPISDANQILFLFQQLDSQPNHSINQGMNTWVFHIQPNLIETSIIDATTALWTFLIIDQNDASPIEIVQNGESQKIFLKRLLNSSQAQNQEWQITTQEVSLSNTPSEIRFSNGATWFWTPQNRTSHQQISLSAKDGLTSVSPFAQSPNAVISDESTSTVWQDTLWILMAMYLAFFALFIWLYPNQLPSTNERNLKI